MSEDQKLLYALYETVTSIDEKVDEMRVVQAQQQKDIEHHIKRTDLLEEHHNALLQKVDPWITLGKALAIGAAAAAAIAAVLEVIDRLK